MQENKTIITLHMDNLSDMNFNIDNRKAYLTKGSDVKKVWGIKLDDWDNDKYCV
ncbi:hypothetical protein NWP96_07845 [Mycoplasmopsis cynos]|nr:hypothetical protein [Mycoplasmopsis cynos]